MPAAPAFTGVYVFGDSLVDPGNDLRAAQFIGSFPFVGVPSGAPTADKGYFDGRFTDGLNFADLISNKFLSAPTKPTFPFGFSDPALGITVPFENKPSGINLSFAYGGATAIRGDNPAPGLDEQTTETGGPGADLFHSFSGAGIDRVLDFNPAEGDRVMLDPGTTWTVTQVGGDTVVDLGGGDQVILVGVQMSALPAGWIFTG